MKFLFNIIKYFLDLIAYLIKKSPTSLKYIFSYPLKKEVENYIENIYYKEYEHIKKAILLEKNFYNKSNSIILDIGAADGTTAKIFRKSYPQKKIYAFEPLAENLIELNKIKENENIIVIPIAAGAKIEKREINKANRITSSSFYKLENDLPSELFSNSFKTDEIREIEITTLDEVITNNENICILKIDVQGFELEVLKGATNTLCNTFCIVLEMNNHEYYKGSPKYFEIDEFLRKNKFVLCDTFPSTKENNKLIEWDSIYLNSKYK